MFLNFMALTDGREVLFHADTEEEAKTFLLEYLRETAGKKLLFAKWDPVKKEYIFAENCVIEIPEIPKEHTAIYKIITTFFKYVEVTGIEKEAAFAAKAKKFVRNLPTLPEIDGYASITRVEDYGHTDDDQYRAAPPVKYELPPTDLK